jgi:iron-sulfur cluster insertion protein
MNNFIISKNASDMINLLNNKEGENNMLRIKVEGGGCNGLKYQIYFTDAQKDADCIFTKDGAKILIDKISLGFLKDSELDYYEDLGSAAFIIKNPNSSSNCGCGQSFSYEQ